MLSIKRENLILKLDISRLHDMKIKMLMSPSLIFPMLSKN